MFSALKVRNFRLYWTGMLISLIGSWIQAVAQSWLVFQLTNSAFLLGMVGFLSSAPVFVLSLFAGVIVDKVNKRKILIFTQSAYMVLAFLLAVMTQLRMITAWQIMIIALLNGAVMAFDAPCRQAVVVELVGKKHLLNAIVLNSVSFNSSRMIGPALAGILIAAIGMSGCFYVNAVSFLAVLAALFVIKLEHGPVRPPKENSILENLKDGLRVIRRDRVIFTLITIVGVSSLFGTSYMILMPIFASDILKVGIKGLGVLMSSVGIGALLAALMLAAMGDFKHKGRFLLSCCIIFSLSLIIFAVSKFYLLSIFALILVGGSSVAAMALINTLLQSMASDEFRGRIMSVFMFTFAGLMPFGNLIAGSFSQGFGVSLTVLACGIISLVFFLVVHFVFPEIEKI